MIMRARVTGRVQGVGFRFWVRQQAQTLGLTGWVRNTYDNAVELLAEGDESQLGELERRLWTGPTLSHVATVNTSFCEGGPTHSGFDVVF